MNTIGTLYRLSTFGESHGTAIGGIIDGIPAGIPIDTNAVQQFLSRRRPGQSDITTTRNETDHVEILSGLFENKTTGTPIGFIIPNTDTHPSDYDNQRNLFRPSHADYTYTIKYGLRDHRGGGRTSARETIARCVAGAIALQILQHMNISITAFTSQVGPIKLPHKYTHYDLSHIDDNKIRCPDPETALEMEKYIKQIKAQGDTIGGIITCVAKGVPPGWGEPVFDKLHADLGKAMLSINAVKGFEYGMGFSGVTMKGSEANDIFQQKNGQITTRSNHSGGIQGGISNGEDIYFRVAFKPVATILQPIETITTDGQTTTLKAQGRHDPCVLPRAVPIVEAMTAIVLLDHSLQHNSRKNPLKP